MKKHKKLKDSLSKKIDPKRKFKTSKRKVKLITEEKKNKFDYLKEINDEQE